MKQCLPKSRKSVRITDKIIWYDKIIRNDKINRKTIAKNGNIINLALKTMKAEKGKAKLANGKTKYMVKFLHSKTSKHQD